MRAQRFRAWRDAPADPGRAARAASARARRRTGAPRSNSRASAHTRVDVEPARCERVARATSRNCGSWSRRRHRRPRRARRIATRPVPQPRSSTSGALVRTAPPRAQVGRVAAALDVVPDRRRSMRSFPERRRVAARGQHVAQLEQRGVGGQGVERAPRAVPVRLERTVEAALERAARPRAAPCATPAYLRRSASSSARVPEQTTRAAWGASVSKSASQIQEMSRPSAMRSLRTIHTSRPAPSAAASVRKTSFAPAGILDQQDRELAIRRGRSAPRGRTRPRRTRARAGSRRGSRRAAGNRRRRRGRCRRCRGRGGAARRALRPAGRRA